MCGEVEDNAELDGDNAKEIFCLFVFLPFCLFVY